MIGNPMNIRRDRYRAVPALDAPVMTSDGHGWLLSYVDDVFVAMVFCDDATTVNGISNAFSVSTIPVRIVQVAWDGAPEADKVIDNNGLAAERYGATSGATYLVRPERHVPGCIRDFKHSSVPNTAETRKPCLLRSDWCKRSGR